METFGKPRTYQRRVEETRMLFSPRDHLYNHKNCQCKTTEKHVAKQTTVEWEWSCELADKVGGNFNEWRQVDMSGENSWMLNFGLGLVYDRNGNFYRNTETDRNWNFSTETEITETETKPNLFSIDIPLILEIKETTNHSWNISTQNNLLLRIHFKKIPFQYFLVKFTFFIRFPLKKALHIKVKKFGFCFGFSKPKLPKHRNTPKHWFYRIS